MNVSSKKSDIHVCAGHDDSDRFKKQMLKKREKKKKNSLTSSNNSSSSSTSLGTSTTKGENQAQPSHAQLLAITVKVRDQRAGGAERTNLAGVRRVANVQEGLDPSGTGGDGTTVHKGVEASSATVRPVTTLTHTTERKGGDVQRGVVDGSTTRAGGGKDLVGVLLGSERIDTQRGGLDAVGDANRLLDAVHGHDGHQGTEALLDQQGVVRAVDLDERGLDEAFGLVHGATQQDLALGVVDHGLELVKVALVDDARVVGRRLSTLRVEFIVGLLELLHDSRHQFALDQEVVMRRADLPSVQGLAPQHATRDQSGVRRLGDNGRVNPTQLQNDGSQMRRSSLGDDATNCRTTSEEDLVPSLSQQGLGLGDTSLDNGVARGVQRSLDNLLHNHSTVGGILTGLDNHRVTSRNSTNHRSQSQLEGEVESTCYVGQLPYLSCDTPVYGVGGGKKVHTQ